MLTTSYFRIYWNIQLLLQQRNKIQPELLIIFIMILIPGNELNVVIIIITIGIKLFYIFRINFLGTFHVLRAIKKVSFSVDDNTYEPIYSHICSYIVAWVDDICKYIHNNMLHYNSILIQSAPHTPRVIIRPTRQSLALLAVGRLRADDATVERGYDRRLWNSPGAG